MKTIAQALKDWIAYPMPDGLIENILVSRGFEPGYEWSYEINASKEFQGAYADCLCSLITLDSVSEADKSIKLSTEVMREQANAIYGAIGEYDRMLGDPQVRFGWN